MPGELMLAMHAVPEPAGQSESVVQSTVQKLTPESGVTSAPPQMGQPAQLARGTPIGGIPASPPASEVEASPPPLSEFELLLHAAIASTLESHAAQVRPRRANERALGPTKESVDFAEDDIKSSTSPGPLPRRPLVTTWSFRVQIIGDQTALARAAGRVWDFAAA
jgi:hypothetical protein